MLKNLHRQPLSLRAWKARAERHSRQLDAMAYRPVGEASEERSSPPPTTWLGHTYHTLLAQGCVFLMSTLTVVALVGVSLPLIALLTSLLLGIATSATVVALFVAPIYIAYQLFAGHFSPYVSSTSSTPGKRLRRFHPIWLPLVGLLAFIVCPPVLLLILTILWSIIALAAMCLPGYLVWQGLAYTARQNLCWMKRHRCFGVGADGRLYVGWRLLAYVLAPLLLPWQTLGRWWLVPALRCLLAGLALILLYGVESLQQWCLSLGRRPWTTSARTFTALLGCALIVVTCTNMTTLGAQWMRYDFLLHLHTAWRPWYLSLALGTGITLLLQSLHTSQDGRCWQGSWRWRLRGAVVVLAAEVLWVGLVLPHLSGMPPSLTFSLSITGSLLLGSVAWYLSQQFMAQLQPTYLAPRHSLPRLTFHQATWLQRIEKIVDPWFEHGLEAALEPSTRPPSPPLTLNITSPTERRVERWVQGLERWFQQASRRPWSTLGRLQLRLVSLGLIVYLGAASDASHWAADRWLAPLHHAVHATFINVVMTLVLVVAFGTMLQPSVGKSLRPWAQLGSVGVMSMVWLSLGLPIALGFNVPWLVSSMVPLCVGGWVWWLVGTCFRPPPTLQFATASTSGTWSTGARDLAGQQKTLLPTAPRPQPSEEHVPCWEKDDAIEL